MIRLTKGKEKKSMSTLGSMAEGLIPLLLASQTAQTALGEIMHRDKYFYNRYKDKKYKKLNELKGGKENMETKSRYEVIAELEEKKRGLILERDSLDKRLKDKQRSLKELKRDIEDKEEEIQEFEDSMKTEKETISELIKSVDESLNRFANLGTSKKS